LQVKLDHIGKKFRREWIFRGITHLLEAGSRTVILGGNGSGKSTLLQIIAGYVTPTEGHLRFSRAGSSIDPAEIPGLVSFASPYLQLPDELTLSELIAHAAAFKPFLPEVRREELPGLMGLAAHENKFLREYSSGMKQRVRLALAILSDTPLLLLDEPASNLDARAVAWYKSLISAYSANRTICVASNALSDEHYFCDTAIDVTTFK
jgi:ABC-type multidrug transport system ATPase subunit